MKHRMLVVVILVLASLLTFSAGVLAQDQPITLTMGSWRVDDVAQMQVILDAFNAVYPNITTGLTQTSKNKNETINSKDEQSNATGLLSISVGELNQLHADLFCRPQPRL